MRRELRGAQTGLQGGIAPAAPRQAAPAASRQRLCCCRGRQFSRHGGLPGTQHSTLHFVQNERRCVNVSIRSAAQPAPAWPKHLRRPNRPTHPSSSDLPPSLPPAPKTRNPPRTPGTAGGLQLPARPATARDLRLWRPQRCGEPRSSLSRPLLPRPRVPAVREALASGSRALGPSCMISCQGLPPRRQNKNEVTIMLQYHLM